MPDVTNELIYEILKQIPTEIALARGDLRDIKVRVTSAEENLAGVNRRLDVSTTASTDWNGGRGWLIIRR
ncbi:hypothetical protein BH10PSE7_BH10PSE7_39610 [soil metagenome]